MKGRNQSNSLPPLMGKDYYKANDRSDDIRARLEVQPDHELSQERIKSSLILAIKKKKKIVMQGMFKVSKDISRLQGKHIAGKQPEYFIIELVNR